MARPARRRRLGHPHRRLRSKQSMRSKVNTETIKPCTVFYPHTYLGRGYLGVYNPKIVALMPFRDRIERDYALHSVQPVLPAARKPDERCAHPREKAATP